MRAGKLNQFIAIQRPVRGQDALGGMAPVIWVDVATGVPARMTPLSGTERRVTAVGGEAAEARTEIEIRHRPGVDAECRIIHRGAIYNVRHVKDLNSAGRVLILNCDTGVNHG